MSSLIKCLGELMDYVCVFIGHLLLIFYYKKLTIVQCCLFPRIICLMCL